MAKTKTAGKSASAKTAAAAPRFGTPEWRAKHGVQGAGKGKGTKAKAKGRK